jgi:imidazolonepropionase-like amidohydrolase
MPTPPPRVRRFHDAVEGVLLGVHLSPLGFSSMLNFGLTLTMMMRFDFEHRSSEFSRPVAESQMQSKADRWSPRIRGLGKMNGKSAVRCRNGAPARALTWRSVSLLVVMLTTCVLASGVVAQPGDAGLTVADVTVVSPERASPFEHAYVQIEDGRIAEVSGTRIAGEAQIDGRGRYLIPGLIDTHTHLGAIPGMLAAHTVAHPDLATVARAQIPRSYLYSGFTTVLDLAGDPAGISAWNDLTERPDAYFCGGAPLLNGYSFEGVDREPYFLLNPEQAAELPPTVEPAEHTPAVVVARMAKDGAICVKTYAERGFGPGSSLPMPTPGLIQGVVTAAHARGMPVFMHANSMEAHTFALEVGVDVIAHGMWNGYRLQDGALPPDAATVVDQIMVRGLGYQPTARVLPGIAAVFDRDLLSTSSLAEVVPGALIAWYATDEGGFFRDELSADLGPRASVAMNDAPIEALRLVIARLAASDAPLLFGTDTPGSPTFANPPGLNGRWEMTAWIDAGVGEDQLLRAMTFENARVMRLDGEIGTVEPGKIANLLLLGENPLASVEAYDSIETVFLRGRPIDRATLTARRSSMLSFSLR